METFISAIKRKRTKIGDDTTNNMIRFTERSFEVVTHTFFFFNNGKPKLFFTSLMSRSFVQQSTGKELWKSHSGQSRFVL